MMKLLSLLIIVVGSLWFSNADAACSGSGTTWSCQSNSTRAEVQAAHDAAGSGYTITLAIGTYTWDATSLVLTKAGTLAGSGTPVDLVPTGTTGPCNPGAQTCITSSVGGLTWVIVIAPTSDLSIRVTNLQMTLNAGVATNNGQGAVIMQNTSLAFPQAHTRVDGLTIRGGGNCLKADGWIEGVFDHNRVENCYDAIFVADGAGGNNGKSSWDRMYTTFGSGGVAAVGTQHAVFFEDMVIVHTGNDFARDADPYSDRGGSVVVRHSKYHYSTYTGFYVPLGDHGNLSAVDSSGSNQPRGAPVHEDYDNEYHGTGCEVDAPRGGSHLFFNNQIFCSSGTHGVRLLDEDQWNRGANNFPNQDQIINSFYWNNTINGAPQSAGFVVIDSANTSTVIQQDRDYFLHAPQATGGKCIYTGRPGASGVAPFVGDGGTESCSSSGANAYFPYTPYTYPHPLVGGAPPVTGCTGSGLAWSCASGSTPSDVQTAVNNATEGFTITFAAGTYSWSTGVVSTKAGSFIGAGQGTTTSCTPSVHTCFVHTGAAGVTLIGFGDAPEDIGAGTTINDLPIRISGINFNLGTLQSGRRAIRIAQPYNASSANAKLTQVRLDHLVLVGGGAQNPVDEGGIRIQRWIRGVADHIDCLNVNECFNFKGDNSYNWIRWKTLGDIAAGTSDAFFIEDSTFTLNASCNGLDWDGQVYMQSGAQVVVRYSTFDSSACQNPNFITLMYNLESNFGYSNGTPTIGTDRGTPIFESYNNTCHAYRFASGQCMGFRGGSVVVHDETIIIDNDPAAQTIYITEEEAWQTLLFSPLRSVWPAQDQIYNSFFWNITVNGVPMTTAASTGCGLAILCAGDHGGNDPVFHQINRDFFMHPPQATGGRTTFTGSRFGGSTAAPTPSDTGSMSFSSAGANAYFPYTAYTYPHPLTGAAPPPPPVPQRWSPSVNLRVAEVTP